MRLGDVRGQGRTVVGDGKVVGLTQRAHMRAAAAASPPRAPLGGGGTLAGAEAPEGRPSARASSSGS